MRQHNFFLIFLILILLNVSLSFGLIDDNFFNLSGDNKITDSTPEFIYNFTNDDDIDVKIISFTFHRTDSFNGEILSDHQYWLINETMVDGAVFKFMPAIYVNNQLTPSYLFEGTYRLLLTVIDIDNNEKTFVTEIELEPSEMNIWVSEPRNNFFEETKQKIAISNVSNFLMEIKTEYPSVCKIGYATNIGAESLTQSNFNTLPKSFVQTTPSQTHTMELDVEDNNNKNILKIYPIDNPLSSSNDYLVVCEIDDGLGNKEYVPEVIYAGYLSTPPQIQVDFSPTNITNTLNISTNLNVNSNQLVICKYNFTQNPSPKYYPTSKMFSTIIDEIYDYASFNKINLAFDKSPNTFVPDNFPIEDNLIYNLSVTCYNLANTPSTINNNDFGILLDRNLIITQIYDFFKVKSQSHKYLTNYKSTFEYSLWTTDWTLIKDWTLVDLTPTNTHTFTTTQNDGDYILKIKAESSQDSVVENFPFRVDTSTPDELTILNRDVFCTDGTNLVTLKFSLPSVFQNIQTYDFVLYDYDDEELFSVTKTNLNVGNEIITNVLIPKKDFNKEFYWEITMTAVNGNEDTKTFEFTAKNSDLSVCDSTPPKVSFDLLQTPNTYSIKCQDADSVCKNIYIKETTPSLNCPTSLNSYTKSIYNVQTGYTKTFSWDTQICFALENEGEQITRNYGLPNSINLLSPISGVSNQKQFNLTFSNQISSSSNIVCRSGLKTSQTQFEPIFNSLLYPGIYTTGIYNTYFNLSNNSIFNNAVNPSLTKTWLVSCKDNNIYYTKTFEFGYDTTPPIFTKFQLDPTTVEYSQDPTTTLILETNEPTICSYEVSLNGTEFTSGRLSQGEYLTNHRQIITFNPSVDKEGNYEVNVFCVNKAGLINESSKNLLVKYRNDNGINILTPSYVNSKTFILNATTIIPSKCKYKLNSTASYVDMTTTYSKVHTKSITVSADKMYNIHVNCDSELYTDTEINKKITVDTLAPTLTITTNDLSCSLNKLNVLFEVDLLNGSDFDYILYNVTNSSNTVFTQETTRKFVNVFTLKPIFTPEKQYTISAKVFDKAGNNKLATKTIVASNPNNVGCDFQPPKAIISIKDVHKGKKINVSCSDNIACANTFSYSFVDKLTCNDSDYSKNSVAYSSSNNPLFLNKTKTLCLQIYDTNANNATYLQKIIVLDNCYDGSLSYGEEDLDCGGVCDAIHTCEDYYYNENGSCASQNDCGNGLICHNEVCLRSKFIVISDEDKCTSNTDCGYQEECTIQGICVSTSLNNNDGLDEVEIDTPEIEKESHILSIILIIFGILMMGGGSYYIYYSRKKKAEETRQRIYQEHQMMQQQQVLQDQKLTEEARKKKIEEMRKKTILSQQKREQIIQNREGERKNILGQFDIKKEQETTAVDEYKKAISKDETKPTEEKVEEPKEEKTHYLDEGMTDEYIDLSTYEPKKENDSSIFEKVANVKKENVKDNSNIKENKSKDEIKKSEKIVEEKPKSTQNSKENKTKSSKEKVDVFKELEKLNKSKESDLKNKTNAKDVKKK
jgi:hypothetical protein